MQACLRIVDPGTRDKHMFMLLFHANPMNYINSCFKGQSDLITVCQSWQFAFYIIWMLFGGICPYKNLQYLANPHSLNQLEVHESKLVRDPQAVARTNELWQTRQSRHVLVVLLLKAHCFFFFVFYTLILALFL